jgi:hypothetical protein
MSEHTQEECYAKSLEMREIAGRCEDPKQRAGFLRMAAEWQRLAGAKPETYQHLQQDSLLSILMSH